MSGSSKNKYDRQLRLWGSNGQKALMESHILLINASPTGSESLKNLVLPGVGRFTILDDQNVTLEDCGNNFFVTRSSVGQSRAKVVTDLLCEMNPDVHGEARVGNALEILEKEPSYFDNFNIIIVCDSDIITTTAISNYCYTKGIHLLIARAYGFLGYSRHVNRLHHIVEGKPASFTPDLRLYDPFPELEAFANTFVLESLDDSEHGHVPMVVLLLQAAKAWKAEFGTVPSNDEQKKAFKDRLLSLRRDTVNADTGAVEKKGEQNFAEAVAKYYYVTQPFIIRDDVLAVLEHEQTNNITAHSHNFFVCAKALKMFYEVENSLPLSGQVPDMTATNEFFINLQAVYTTKAKKDLETFNNFVKQILAGVGRDVNSIEPDYISIFVKNCNFIGVQSMRSLEEELTEAKNDDFFDKLTNEETGEPNLQAAPIWYVGLRAADDFYKAHKRYPGSSDASLAGDEAEILSLGQGIAAAVGLESEVFTAAHAKEIARYGGSILHNVAAFIGGVVSQEAIKAITHQYVPFNNTFIYNGIAGDCATMEI